MKREYRIAWNEGKFNNGNDAQNIISWLEEHVNASMRNGFTPLGGVSVSRGDTEDDSWLFVAQAMIIED